MAFLSAGLRISMTVLDVGTSSIIFEVIRTGLNDSPFNSARCRCIINGQKLPAYIYAHIYQCHAYIVHCACVPLVFSDDVTM